MYTKLIHHGIHKDGLVVTSSTVNPCKSVLSGSHAKWSFRNDQ